MKDHPLEVQLIAWNVIKWRAEQEMKAVQAQIDRRIERLKRNNSKISKNLNTDG